MKKINTNGKNTESPAKSVLKNMVLAMTVLMLAATASSCNDDEEDIADVSSSQLKAIVNQYVNNTVIATYRLLADNAMDLQQACSELYLNPTQTNADYACSKWIAARKYWEESEAFLYGPASTYSIDPHIDSWPLDQQQLNNLLANQYAMSQMSADYLAANCGYGLLGFHALEYVLFRDGQPRPISQIPTTELNYAKAVAEDLCRQCIRLEASWAGMSKISVEKQQILEDCELEPDMNYGEILINAGQSGYTLFRTLNAAISQILMGCSDIADEVGNTKIADPVASGNVLDVESWYSWNSIADFADNIRGISYVYNGGRPENSNSYSVSSYISFIDPSLDGKIRQAITDAIYEIENMPAPFRNHLTETETNAAKQACQKLQALLDDAMDIIN
ncbi:MAG: peptidase M75 [Bacteroidales bacterium]|jgi:predicted lipoprotein|nr:peptidase M75 [Bacteroidales bacterium]